MNAVIEQPLTEPERQKSAYERLTRRQRKFVEHFASGCSAAEALRQTGYKGLHPNVIGARWRHDPLVSEAIEERTRELIEAAGARAQKVIWQMQAVGNCDPRRLVDENGEPIPLHKLDPETAAAIASVKIKPIRGSAPERAEGEEGDEAASEESEVRYSYEYRLWDKNKANDRIGQFLKLWDAERRTVNVDARSVTNVHNTAVVQAGLPSVAQWLEGFARASSQDGAAPSLPDGSVLPVEVHAGEEGS